MLLIANLKHLMHRTSKPVKDWHVVGSLLEQLSVDDIKRVYKLARGKFEAHRMTLQNIVEFRNQCAYVRFLKRRKKKAI